MIIHSSQNYVTYYDQSYRSIQPAWHRWSTGIGWNVLLREFQYLL
jgi:hypothetical protein